MLWLLDSLVWYFFIVKSENYIKSLLIFGNLGVAEGKVLGILYNRPVG